MTATDDGAARRAAELVGAWLSAQSDLEVARDGERAWSTTLAGEHKRAIPVALWVGERALHVESFFMRAPDEREGEVFGLLLRRNLDTGLLRFARHHSGDLVLTGRIPLTAVDAELLDEVLGTLLEVVDGTFNAAIRAGFATYLAHEQRWRRQVGAPPNPVGRPTDGPGV